MPGVIRIITANLYNGRTSPSALRRLLRAERPDVFATQELSPNAARVIADELRYGWLDPRRDYHGVGLALRHESVVERFSMDHRDGHRCVLLPEHWPQLTSPLEIINVHLLNPLLRPIRLSVAIRRRQVEQIVEHVRTERRARVIVGDFNATPLWPAYRRIAEVIQDASLVVGSPRRTWGPTWRMPRLLRIDHAFIEGVVPFSAKTRRIRGADHSALVLDLHVGA